LVAVRLCIEADCSRKAKQWVSTVWKTRCSSPDVSTIQHDIFMRPTAKNTLLYRHDVAMLRRATFPSLKGGKALLLKGFAITSLFYFSSPLSPIPYPLN